VQTRSDEGSEHPIDDGGAQSLDLDAHSSGGKKGYYFYRLDFFDNPALIGLVAIKKMLRKDFRGWFC
jgi:hypothetical protein